LPEALSRGTGAAGELDEGSRIAAKGVLTAAPDALADGMGLWIDDGSGPIRVVATPAALNGITLRKGLSLQVVGPLGQHVSGSSPGYRIEATEPGSVIVVVDDGAGPSPSPSPTPSPSPAPSVAPIGSSTDLDVDLESIAAARQQPVGTLVDVAGVVTVVPGLVGTDGLFAIQDSSGGVFVRPTAPLDSLQIGRSIEVAGIIAAPYGQLEVRQLQRLVLGPTGPQPSPTPVQLTAIGEGSEGILATVHGTVDSVETDSGRLSLVVGDGQWVLRVFANPQTGLTTADVKRGSNVVVIGVVGQRATALGRADGYRLWLRARSDLTTGGDPGVGSGASPSPHASASVPAIHHDLASALEIRGSLVDLTATVTASVGLIDWGGPTIVVDDGTAACAIVVPAGTDAIRVGSRVHVTGKVGSWQSGPRVVATLVQTLGELQATQTRQVGGALTAQQEWQLVQASGRISRLVRVGVRWRADLLVAGRTVAVLGEPAAGIAASSVLPGHMAVVVGIVRRSTSNSGEFELLPRSALDLRVGPSLNSVAALPGSATAGKSAGVASSSAHDGISSLPNRLGQTVVVSGLVVDAESGSVTIDDGTGRIRLGGAAAAEAIALLEPGDVVEARGLVQRDAGGLLVDVDPASFVALSAVGDGPSPSAVATEDRPPDRAATLQPGPPVANSQGSAPWLVVAAFVLAAGSAAAFSMRSWRRRAIRLAGLGRLRTGRKTASDGPNSAF
jgi:DNA/RNA endonuclease YhcR with UshA esterase domain